MPVSPVCLDTLVLATVGAAKNLLKLEAIKNLFLVTGTTGHVGMKVLAIPVSGDIQHPLLLPVKSNNILIAGIIPAIKTKSKPFRQQIKKDAERDCQTADDANLVASTAYWENLSRKSKIHVNS